MVVPAGCAADRARPGHHHRHHANPLPHPLARRRADRRARPRRIPPQHDHRRLAGRRRGADHRRAGRRARPDPAARLSAASAGHQAGRDRRQQDGPRRFQRRPLQGDQRRDFGASDRPRRDAVGGDSDFRARRRRRCRTHAADRLVPGTDRGRGARCARTGAAAGAAGAAAAGAGDLQIRRPPHRCGPHRVRQLSAPATKSSSCPPARSRRSRPSRAGR